MSSQGQWRHEYPEIAAYGPSNMEGLRRSQLHNLCRAYGIAVDPNAPKYQILPLMRAAADQGLFKRPPIHPEYAEMALRNPDDLKRPEETAEPIMNIALTPEAKAIYEKGAVKVQESQSGELPEMNFAPNDPWQARRMELKQLGIQELRQVGKSLGINMWQMGKDDAIESIVTEEAKVGNVPRSDQSHAQEDG